MDRKEVKENYGRKVCERLTEALLRVGEGLSVNEVFRVFKDAVTAEVIEYRPVSVQRKENT